MKMNRVDETGLIVPEICLGTMNWGQQNTEAEAHAQLDYAVDERGIIFIDTAELYPVPASREKQGLTETYIGTWLKKRGKRDDLIIASKVNCGEMVATRNSSHRYDRRNIREALEGTLARLGTSYVDIYYIHWPEREANFFGVRGVASLSRDQTTPIRETLRALSELMDEGKIRHIGVSNETPWGLMEYLRLAREEGLPRVEIIQNQYSLTNRTFEIGLSEMILHEKVSLAVYSPLNGGVLSGKYLDGSPEGARFTLYAGTNNAKRYHHERAEAATRRYVAIAQRHNLDPVQMALTFVRSRPFVATTIVGATNVEQLKADIDSAKMVLSDEVLSEIEAVHREMPDMTW